MHGARGGRPIVNGRYSQKLKNTPVLYDSTFTADSAINNMFGLAEKTLEFLKTYLEKYQAKDQEEGFPAFRAFINDYSKLVERATNAQLHQAQTLTIEDVLHLSQAYAHLINLHVQQCPHCGHELTANRLLIIDGLRQLQHTPPAKYHLPMTTVTPEDSDT